MGRSQPRTEVSAEMSLMGDHASALWIALFLMMYANRILTIGRDCSNSRAERQDNT
jgi:hypothetical protein